MIDAMTDIETLATENDALVASIGIVLMDMDDLRVLPDRLHVVLNWDEQFEKGRRCHPNTVRFWLEQSKEAQAGILTAPTMSNIGILECIRDFIPVKAGVWGNGADFDCVILQSLYRTYGVKCPWKYSQHRCFRTMKNISIIPAPERVGVHHNALDDAVFQAEWLMKILRMGQ